MSSLARKYVEHYVYVTDNKNKNNNNVEDPIWEDNPQTKE